MKKEPSYRRITWTDRLKIEALYNAGHSFRFIARELDFVLSAIHYEVQHGLYDHLDGKTYLYVKKYSATLAQEYADQQATSKGVPIKLGKRHAPPGEPALSADRRKLLRAKNSAIGRWIL